MKITVEKVAKELGVTPPTVRNLIDNGQLPIAAVMETGSRKKYVILPKPLYEATGIKIGYEPPVEIDCDLLAEKIKEKLKELI